VASAELERGGMRVSVGEEIVGGNKKIPAGCVNHFSSEVLKSEI
jgi:hypothetical protein